MTVVHRGGDVGAAARTAATTADTIILYDARHAPLQHTLDWNATIKNARACAALLPDDVERVGTARKANGIVLSNREARKASGATVADILTNIKCRVAPMPSDEDKELPYRKPEPRSIQAITRAWEWRLVRRLLRGSPERCTGIRPDEV